MLTISPEAQDYINELQQQLLIMSDRACGMAARISDLESENKMLRSKLKEEKSDEPKQ